MIANNDGHRLTVNSAGRKVIPARLSPFLVGVMGGTGSGKTTFAHRLAKLLRAGHTVAVVELDSYYKDLNFLSQAERLRINFDHPDSFDLKRLGEDLGRLKQGKAIIKPVYDFKTQTRYPGGSVIVPGEIVIVEGLMLLVDENIRIHFDLKVFVDTPPEVRLRRRLEKDVRERGHSLAGAIDHYIDSVLPMHEHFVEPAKNYSDFVIPGYGDSESDLSGIASAISKGMWPQEAQRSTGKTSLTYDGDGFPIDEQRTKREGIVR
jgi:uridine kinase